MKALAFCACLCLAAPAFANPCPDCKEENLCSRHENLETLGIQKFEKVWRETSKKADEKSVMSRRQALDDLGKLNDAHTGATTVKMAEEVAKGLADPETGIRQLAIQYLGANQHKSTATIALGKALAIALPKVKDPRSQFDTAAGVLWDNNFKYIQQLLDAMAGAACEDGVDYLIKAIQSTNPDVVVYAMMAVTATKGDRLVDAVLEQMHKLMPIKDEEKKDPPKDPTPPETHKKPSKGPPPPPTMVERDVNAEKKKSFDALDGAFKALTGFSGERKAGYDAYLRDAELYWRDKQKADGK